MRHFSLPAVLLAIATIAMPQALPPGKLPPGPPAQPGQLGPARAEKPNPQESPQQNTESKTAGNQTSQSDVATLPPVTTRVVLVPTSVLDPDGHGYVNGLATTDFELFDNDKPQKINADFSQLPLSLVLVVQANSEIEPVLPQLKKTGILFQGLVTGADGDVAVLSFDHRMQHLQDFTNDPEKLDDAMQKLTAGSSSARLIDAVIEADHMLRRHDPQNRRRRVVVLLSRNIDKGSESHLQETVRSMQFDNVIVYCVDISKVLTAVMKKPDYPRPAYGGVPPEARGSIAGGQGPRTQTSDAQEMDGNVLNAVPPILRGIHDLFKKTPAEAFSYFTGGRLYSFATQRTLETVITDIGADLNSQYLLSYSPNNTNEPGFHTIKVNVDRPGLKVRVRPGYWWGGGAQ
jgi:VWFA-related protein